jgi:F420-0:gamma-glutamyl ligase
MQFIKVHTRTILPPKDDIYNVIDEFMPPLKEGDVLLITSKVLAIHQGRCVKMGDSVDKDDLITKESEKYIPRHQCPNDAVILGIKQHTLLPSGGIDESNGDGYYILWPEKINELAKEICNYLKKKFQLKKIAVIITDSHCVPLRYGVVGISIGFYGLEPLKDYRGKKDIFGREIKMSTSNIVDALSTMGVLLMGEGDEKIPMVILRGADFVKFTNKDTYKDFVIPEQEDIYFPLLKIFHDS